MLVKNLDVSKGEGTLNIQFFPHNFLLSFSLTLCGVKGLTNGARGVVIGWDETRKGYPTIRFASGIQLTIEPAKWSIESPNGQTAVSRAIPSS